MGCGISKTENSISELEVDMENDNTLGEYGLCPECNKPYSGYEWCNQCNAKRFQQDFQIGLAEIIILTILFKKLNLVQKGMMKY